MYLQIQKEQVAKVTLEYYSSRNNHTASPAKETGGLTESRPLSTWRLLQRCNKLTMARFNLRRMLCVVIYTRHCTWKRREGLQSYWWARNYFSPMMTSLGLRKWLRSLWKILDFYAFTCNQQAFVVLQVISVTTTMWLLKPDVSCDNAFGADFISVLQISARMYTCKDCLIINQSTCLAVEKDSAYS